VPATPYVSDPQNLEAGSDWGSKAVNFGIISHTAIDKPRWEKKYQYFLRKLVI
jgi:hypothetical protein